MAPRLFIVDTEATSRSPFSGVMTEFGVVEFETRQWFHGVLHNAMPSPDNPALPVLSGRGPAPFYRRDTDPDIEQTGTRRGLYEALTDWIRAFDGDRAVLVSDNPGFDAAWLAYGFDEEGLPNPFGHSSRRIGDLAAGLDGKWRNTSAWKRHRKTVHDHNPVHDALGNAEALHTVLVKHQQIRG